MQTPYSGGIKKGSNVFLFVGFYDTAMVSTILMLSNEIYILQCFLFFCRFSLPRLYKMAIDYLATPASSVPSKEANSEAKLNFEGRARLHPCTFKAKMCLQSWITVLQTANIALPQDFHEAFDSLNLDWDELIVEDSVIDYMVTDNKQQGTQVEN